MVLCQNDLEMSLICFHKLLFTVSYIVIYISSSTKLKKEDHENQQPI
jgi:hypothetical protein